MYEIGMKVMYGSTGVCEITEIREQVFPVTGESRLYYVLSPMYEKTTISVPVDSDKVFLRPIISRQEAEQLIADIPTVHPQVCNSRVTKELTEHYDTIIKSHDCAALVEMTMSIYQKKQEALEHNRKFGSTDERYFRQAENLLFGELAAALEIPKESVQSYIEERLEEAQLQSEAAT